MHLINLPKSDRPYLIEQIHGLKNGKKSRTVNLSGSHVDCDIIINHLCPALANNNTIHRLLLDNNDISSEGVIALCKVLEQNTSVHTLTLRNNIFGSNGYNALRTLFEKTKTLRAIDCLTLQRQQGCDDSVTQLDSDESVRLLYKTIVHAPTIDQFYARGIKTDDECNAVVSLLDVMQLRCKVVDLSDSHIRPEQWKLIFGSLDKTANPFAINKLVLNNCSIGNELESVLIICDLIKNSPNLEHIELSDNKLEEGDIDLLCDAFSKRDSVKHVDLSHNNLTVESMMFLDEYMCHVGCVIETLFLNYNEINDLCELESRDNMKIRWKSLKHLDLSFNNINYKDTNYLVPIMQKCPSLERLDISGNYITPDGVTRLAGAVARDEPSIKTLILYDVVNEEDGEDGDDFVHSLTTAFDPEKTALTKIGLASNYITDDGIKTLLNWISNVPSVRKVDLRENAISENGYRLVEAFCTKTSDRSIEFKVGTASYNGTFCESHVDKIQKTSTDHNEIVNDGCARTLSFHPINDVNVGEKRPQQ